MRVSTLFKGEQYVVKRQPFQAAIHQSSPFIFFCLLFLINPSPRPSLLEIGQGPAKIAEEAFILEE